MKSQRKNIPELGNSESKGQNKEEPMSKGESVGDEELEMEQVVVIKKLASLKQRVKELIYMQKFSSQWGMDYSGSRVPDGTLL